MMSERLMFCITTINQILIITFLLEENKALIEARPTLEPTDILLPVSPKNIIWAFTETEETKTKPDEKAWPVQVIRDEIDLSRNPWLIFSTTEPWNFRPNDASRRELASGEYSVTMVSGCLFICYFLRRTAPATLTHFINSQKTIVEGHLPLRLEFWPTDSNPIVLHDGLK